MKDIVTDLLMPDILIFPSSIYENGNIFSHWWEKILSHRGTTMYLLKDDFPLLQAAILPEEADDIDPPFEFGHIDAKVAIDPVLAVT